MKVLYPTGNPAEIYNYTYDASNQLIREDIYTPNLQKSVKYTYNSIGNLTGIFNYDYTLSDLPSTSLTSKIYYYNPSKPDQLTRINYFVGAICNSTHDYYYDAIGNLSYVENYDTFESESFGWEGRMLISYAVDSAQGYGEIDYTYNDQGIRTSKNVWGTMHTYVLDGDRVLEEKIGLNTIIYYTYDVDGTLISMNYNGNEYFYITNLQGDIIEMVNISGNTVVKYRYDAWGNITYQYGGTLASINPYRYRGYRYDQETNLYYLQSRYYDPEIGRFISRDSTGYLDPMSNQGLNLYAYCGNNPVIYKQEHIFGMSITAPAVSVIRTNDNGIIAGNANLPRWIQMSIGAIPDIILGVRYLLATGMHSKFAYAANTRYMHPIIGGTWRSFGISGSSWVNLGNLTQGTFRQILTGNAKAGFGAIAKSVGSTLALTSVVNFGFNLYENNWQVDSGMIIDTAIDTAIGVSAYYMAAGTMSLIVAGVVMTGIAVPGIVVVGGVVLLSIGYDYLIREVTGYRN